MMKKYYIYVLTQQGNVGAHEIKLIGAPGFDSEGGAEEHLISLIEKREGTYFERNWYHFVILPTYRSKHAFYLENKKKDIREVEGFDTVIANLFYSKGITCLHDIEKIPRKQLMKKFNKVENFEDLFQGIVKKYLLSIKY